MLQNSKRMLQNRAHWLSHKNTFAYKNRNKMKSLLTQMTDDNEQIKTQIKKMTGAILAVSVLILLSLVMIITNFFN